MVRVRVRDRANPNPNLTPTLTLTLTLTLTQVRGCWLLSPEWLLASLDSGRFLPEARRYRVRARG